MVEQKYNTHIVFKVEDAKKYLLETDRNILAGILRRIDDGRKSEGKKINVYAVCNTDEPYYADVLSAIIDGEAAKEAEKE